MEKFLISYTHTEKIMRPWRQSREPHLTVLSLAACMSSCWVVFVCLNLYLYNFSCSLPKTKSLHWRTLKDFLLWIGLKLGGELGLKQPHSIPWDDWKAWHQLAGMCGVSWFWCTPSRQYVTCHSSPMCTLVPSVGTVLYQAGWKHFIEKRSSDVPLRKIK